jgi:hypothetical protein
LKTINLSHQRSSALIGGQIAFFGILLEGELQRELNHAVIAVWKSRAALQPIGSADI